MAKNYGKTMSFSACVTIGLLVVFGNTDLRAQVDSLSFFTSGALDTLIQEEIDLGEIEMELFLLTEKPASLLMQHIQFLLSTDFIEVDSIQKDTKLSLPELWLDDEKFNPVTVMNKI